MGKVEKEIEAVDTNTKVETAEAKGNMFLFAALSIGIAVVSVVGCLALYTYLYNLVSHTTTCWTAI